MDAEVLSGTVLGTCTLQKVIGRGGMGAVFLAQQSRPRRQVAVKVLLPVSKLQPGQQAAFLERFRRETDTAASLDHPNILPVHECGEHDGLAYLVMPYVSGGTLRDELEAEGKLPFTRIVSYLDQIASALDFAHERGIIHRDIKPANLLMTPEKRLMLTDFGLVKIITGGQTQNPLSETGMPMGTPEYMAPEQVLGGEIDTRADIYSMGVILYQMVTGSVPFKGEMPMKVALQHLNTLPPQPRSLRPDLPLRAEEVILRALAKRPADRYMFAHDLANAFRQALQSTGVHVGGGMNGQVSSDDSAGNRSRGLFNPMWQGATEDSSFPNVPSSGPIATESAMDMLRDMVNRTGTLPDTSTPTSTPTPPTQPMPHASPAYPSGTRLAKKLLVAHSEQGKREKDGQKTMPPTSNEPKQPLASTRYTPAPAVQEASNVQQGTFLPEQYSITANEQKSQDIKEESWPALTNNTQPPQRLRFGQKTKQYNLQQDLPERETNQVPQVFQFSPAEPDHSYGSNLHDATTPVQTVQFNDIPQGGQFDAASNAAHNRQNSLNTRKPGTQSLLSGDGQSGAKGLGRPGTVALTLNDTQHARITRQLGQDTGMLPTSRSTGTLQHPVGEYSGDTGMLRLHQPVKVVKVPIAGQPGQYMTGILPVLQQAQPVALPAPATPQSKTTTLKDKAKQYSKIIVLATVVLLVLFTSGIYMLTRPTATQTSTARRSVGVASANNPNATATAGISATATAEETNLILDDPLNENFHNWLQGDVHGRHYEFKNGAYHIRNDDNVLALAALFNLPVPAKYSYSLSMQPVTGNQDSPFNYYGMMLRYSVDKNQTPTFYFFSIINNKNQSKYQFRRYDGHKPMDQSPWAATLFEHPIGPELHKGNQPNIIKVIVDGNHFTFMINGKQIGDAHDDTYKETGAIGMGVNQKGSEVAFTNFRLVRLQ